MKVWDCWKDKPRHEDISPCGYLDKESDSACRGCADNPKTARDIKVDMAVVRTAESWARRWGIG